MAANKSKAELIERAADAAGVDSADARAVIEAFIEEVADDIVTHGRARVERLGVFEVIEAQPRVGRDPRNGRRVDIAAARRARFTAAATIKRRLREFGDFKPRAKAGAK